MTRWKNWAMLNSFLGAFPHINKIKLNPNPYGDLGDHVYYNSADSSAINTFVRSNFQPPVIGKEYLLPITDRYNINFQHSPRIERFSRQQIYKFI